MKSRWSDRAVRNTSALDQLVARSRLIGAEPSLVVWGGGNTSSKTVVGDVRGRPVRALLIKGSGSDLATAAPRDFPAVRLDDLTPLFDLDDMDDGAMVTYLTRCLVDPDSLRPSIETLMHAFIPHTHVDHTHADAILAIVNHPDGPARARRLFGPAVGVLPYVRPGFRLAKAAGAAVRANPALTALVLDKHGLVTFGESPRESYERTIALVSRAEAYLRRLGRGKSPLGGRRWKPLPPAARAAFADAVLPGVRGLLGRFERGVLRLDDAPAALDWVNTRAIAQVALHGPATPDHVLHLKPWPCLLPPAAPGSEAAWLKRAAANLTRWASRYQAYTRAHMPQGMTADPMVPRALLIPRLGVITAGRDARAAVIARDLARRNARVQTLGSPLGPYAPVRPKDLCAFEYWPNERFKLTRTPPERDLARRVALVTGAASGIGLACAHALAEAGAHVALADLDGRAAARAAGEIAARVGAGRAIGLSMDVGDEAAVARGMARIVAAYGGIDLLVSNAGVAKVAAIDALELADWERNLRVNATGHFLVARAVVRTLKAQRLGGAMVFIGTKNVPAPGAEFGAYSASKAAEVQLARVLALEGGPHGIRVNVVNPDAIFQGSRLWSKELMRERAKAHGIAVDQLPGFYAARNLLKREIYAEDVAAMTVFLLSERAAKTTGAQVPVDGGVPAAFPR